MEKKWAKPKREISRMEKIKEAVNTRTNETPMVKLKQALKKKTMWVVIVVLATFAYGKQVVKPWYERKKAADAEAYANFLWEKSQKKSIEK